MEIHYRDYRDFQIREVYNNNGPLEKKAPRLLGIVWQTGGVNLILAE